MFLGISWFPSNLLCSWTLSEFYYHGYQIVTFNNETTLNPIRARFFLFNETIRGNLDVVHFRCKNEVSCACNIQRIFHVVQIWETWTIWGMKFLLEKSFSQGEPMRGHLSGNIQQTTKDVCIREIFEKKRLFMLFILWVKITISPYLQARPCALLTPLEDDLYSHSLSSPR